jgi:hypothetical protein
MNPIHHPRLTGALAAAAFLGLPLSSFAESQDAWESTTQRKLAAPDATAARKCLAITKNGFYVGKMNTSSKAVAVEQYASSGAFSKAWTAAFVDLGGLAADVDGNVYAFDQGAAKVYVFDSQGTQLRAFGSPGTGDGQLSASSGYMVNGIAVDEQKNVYVADYANSRVVVFDSAGAFKLKFGSKGDLPGQFRDGPVAVAAPPTGGIVTNDNSVGWYYLCSFTNGGKVLRRGVQGDGTWDKDTYGRSNRGRGAQKLFATSPDGLIFVGEETGNYSTAGLTYGFNPVTLAASTSAAFPTFKTARGAAFDSFGNFWCVRDNGVECLERRARFGAHKPTKGLPQPLVTNVSQAPGSKIVDIDYRVTDADSATVTTALVAFNDGVQSWEKMVIPKTFTGSISGELGSGVSSGGNHRVSWNAAVDMAGKNFASLSFVALAKDDRPEVGVHYVSIPPDAVNSSTLKISHKPVQDDDLKELWIWLLGKGDSRVAISGNTVILTDAGKTYVTGAPLPLSGTAVANVVHNGTTTTTQGRAFACKLMNCRPVTADEKTRANAGRFNLESVSDNSVVSLAP